MDQFVNPFVLPAEDYKRDINVLRQSIDDAARYLSIMTSEPFDECRSFVVSSIKPGGKRAIVDPTVKFYKRENFADRVECEEPFSRYLSNTIQRKDILAPTLTVYVNPEVKESLLVNYIDDNVKARGTAKKAMFQAEREGNKDVQDQKNIEQTNAKLSNNAVSGSHVSASTPLFNKTAHSSLTSTCRSTSGYGNANNEKMMSGNRHYWSARIITNNIISIINNTNYSRLAAVMEKYFLVHPSTEQTMDCIKYSAKLYGINKADLLRIEKLVDKLTPLQKAAFVYTGDLYHIALLNGGMMKEFLRKLITKPTEGVPNPADVLEHYPEDYKALAVQICEVECKGKKDKELIGTKDHEILGATCKNIADTITEYADFIKAFFVTDNVPASVAYFPTSVRRAALVSDTDSTIFTVQDWVKWYFGEIIFGPEANGLAATMIFLASQAIVHILARMSANFGIGPKRIFQVAMKNEFKFDVFVTTQIAKHYFALIGCREGNLYAEYKTEIKGVHLKSSNAAKMIMERAEKMMVSVMKDVSQGKKISIVRILTEVADTEREITASIRSGSAEFFKRGQIKLADSYKKSAEESPYLQYLLWRDVFAPKYGEIAEPPYVAVKLNGDIGSHAKTQEWIDSFDDEELKIRIRAWMARYNRKHFGTFLIPKTVVDQNGIPPEILRTVDIRTMVADMTKVFTIILEALGYYYSNKKITRLISDEY